MIVSDKNRVGPWVAKKIFSQFDPNAEAIGLDRDGEIQAGVIYEDWNGKSIMAHIAIDGKINKSFLFAIFHYPFVHCGVDKIICPVPESNAESRKLVEHMGFGCEARILDAHPDGDLLLYTMKREKCRFLGERYGQRCIPSPRS